MTISGFIAYAIQTWKNKPDTSTPLSAARLAHIEAGIKANSDAITKLAAAVINQQANDVNKIPSSALMYSVNEKVDSAISDLAASSVKCVDGAGMAGSALYADKFGKIICIRGYVKPTNGYSFDAWNRQIVAWLPNNNYLPRGQVTGLTIYSDSRLKIEINVDNSVVLQNLSGSAITANGESGIDIMITYCCQ